jgi:PAS domain S-box-containing protein
MTQKSRRQKPAAMTGATGRPDSEPGRSLVVDDEKVTGDTLAEILASYNHLVQTAIDAIISIDEMGLIVLWNNAAEAMFGYSDVEVMGSPFTLIFPERFREIYRESLNPLTATLGKFKQIKKAEELAGLRKDGTEFPIELALAPQLTEKGLYFTGIIRDISDRKRLESELKQSRESFVSIVEKNRNGILIVTNDGIILYANRSFGAIFRKDKKEFIGQQFGLPVMVDDSVELDIILPDGTPGIAEMQAERTSWKNESSIIVTLQDITKRKHYEESLIKTTEELQRLDKQKSEFISIASHELRTPLTSIKNAVDVIIRKKAGAINENQEKFLGMAQRNINRLSTLLDDLLNISRIESGKIQLQYSATDISILIENVTYTFRSVADKKAISIDIRIAPDLPPLCADASRIEQVLINLLSNAIKFTPDHGRITIDARLRDDMPEAPAEADSFFSISITDTGVGIPEELQKDVFEKFYQVESSLSIQKQAGTGLGLAITKGIVELHGGTIVLESTPGTGSTFSFTLPMTDGKKQVCQYLHDEIATAKQHAAPLSLLVVKLKSHEQFKEVDNGEHQEVFWEKIKQELVSMGIKRTDKIFFVPQEEKLVLVMINTDGAGARIVRQRTDEHLVAWTFAVDNTTFRPVFLSAIATFPVNGRSAEELLDFVEKSIGH